ncbi:hypothetical protein CYMTET_43591 [Cymbomonas tetramitiformis]|uniref:NACHT domain-containing protein n=1 Tax=Cymbomonas tetramitiformis TaxID=36881 RepID=A0AAE0F051_9CHLO|nr:hypothetical protein CYMTET_43591 [Cymbomonas tetramitiformis]
MDGGRAVEASTAGRSSASARPWLLASPRGVSRAPCSPRRKLQCRAREVTEVWVGGGREGAGWRGRGGHLLHDPGRDICVRIRSAASFATAKSAAPDTAAATTGAESATPDAADTAGTPAPSALVASGPELELMYATCRRNLMELADDQPGASEALSKRTGAGRRKALSELLRVCAAADAVAHVIAAQRAVDSSPTLADIKVELGEDIRLLVDVTLDAAARCASAGPETRARLLCLLQSADRLLWAGVEPDVEEKDRSPHWQGRLREIRRVCGVPRAAERAPLGVALQELLMARLELRIWHLPRKQRNAQTAGAVFDLTVGTIKSVLTMKVDETLLRGVQRAAGLAAEAGCRALTAECFAELAVQDQLAMQVRSLPAEGVKVQDGCAMVKEIEQALRSLQQQHFKHSDGEGGAWEPTSGRWEPKAAFAALLAELATGPVGSALHARAMPLPLLWRLCVGDAEGDALGLVDLMSLGLSAPPKGRSPAMLHLARWAQQLSTPGALKGWRERGVEILNEELRRVAEEPRAALAGISGRLQVLRAGAALEQLGASLCKGEAQADRAALKAHSAWRSKAEEILAESGRAVDTLRDVLRAVQTAVDTAKPAATRVTKLLQVLAGPGASFTSASAVASLRRMALPGLQGPPSVEDIRKKARDHLAAQIKDAMKAGLSSEVLAEAVEGLKKDAAAAEKGCRASWEALVSLAPSLEGAVTHAEDCVTEAVRALRVELECGVAVIGAFLMEANLGKRTDSTETEKAMRELMQQHAKAAPRLKRFWDSAMDTLKQGWRADIERVCCEWVPIHVAAVNSGGALSLKLEEAAEDIASRIVDAFLEQNKEEEEDLLCGLLKALEAVEKSLGDTSAAPGADAAKTVKDWTLAEFVGDAVAHADTALAVLEQLAGCLPRCDKELEHISLAIGEALHALTSTASAKKSILPRWFRGNHQPSAPQPADAAEGVSNLVTLLKQLEATLLHVLEDPAKAAENAVAREGENSAPPFVRLLRALDALRWVSFLRLPQASAGSSTAEEVLKKLMQGLGGGVLEMERQLSQQVAQQVQDAANGMKVDAMAMLEAAVAECGAATAVKVVGDVCSAINSPVLGLVGNVTDLARWFTAARPSEEVWRIREVAAFGALRLIHALQDGGEGAAAGSGSGKELSEAASEVEAREKRKEASKREGEELCEAASEVEARKKRREASKRKGEELLERARVLELMRAAVLRCLAFEPEAAVRAVLANGEGLVAETAAAAAGASGAEERGAVEDEARAFAESQEERCGAWSATAGVVEQEMHTRLKALTELQLQAEKETDALQKQELLVQCREAHAALAQASSNVKDVGSTLGVLVEFLSSVDTKLHSISVQLDELQAGVRVLGEDIRRLVGRPVLEELQEKREQRAKQWEQLCDRVHIPIEGMKVDENGEFVRDKQRSQAEEMLTLVTREFLDSEQKDVLLLSGPAGSGKSTFVRQLEHYLESVLAKEYADMLLVMVSLPTLQNPVTNLFAEALRHKGLREAQIYELRNLAQRGEVRLVFLLDAYDELKPQFQFKNLYVTNSLEQYRARESPAVGDTPPGSSDKASGSLPKEPKVIITTRTELLAHDKHYWRHFVPMQVDVAKRDTEDGARRFYLELRIAPFGAKLKEYIAAKVALEVRQAFAKHYGELSPISKQTFEKSENTESDVADLFIGGSSDPLLAAAFQAVSTHEGRRIDGSCVKTLLHPLCEGANQYDKSDHRHALYRVAAVLSLALKTPPQDSQMKDFCDQLPPSKAEGGIWQAQDYEDALDSIPELRQLTTTPFMVKIVTEILPALFKGQDCDASIQTNLLRLLTEDAMQVVWRQIYLWRNEVPNEPAGILAGVRGMWDSDESVTDKGSRASKKSDVESLKAAFAKLVDRVAESLKAKDGMLLEQAPLVEMVTFQDRASKAALEDSHRANEPTERLPVATAEADAPSGEASQRVEGGNTMKEVICRICREVLPYVLQSALRRLPVRRANIYDLFVSMYVTREAQKASTTAGALDSETVKRASEEFSQQLALRMGCENVSKVVIGSSDKLFKKDSVWDSFVRDSGELGALRMAARNAAPVQFQHGVLTFMHKTVQEYLCASGLRHILKQVLREQTVSLEALSEQLRNEQLLAAEKRGASSITNRLLGKHAVRPNNASKTRPADAGSRVVDALTAAKALRQVEASLMASEWMELDLRGGRLAGEEAHACDLLLQNARILLTGKLASRDGGTLLHVAASEGSYSAVSQLLQLLQFVGADTLLEQRDSKERTPLQCAREKQHIQVAAALEVASMPRSVVEELRCELQEQRGRQWTQLHDKVHIPIEGLTEVNGVFPTASNMGKDLLKLVKDEFLDKNAKDVLLISGPAGSGKSTFIQQLEHTLWKMYMEQPTDVLLVSTSLATLRNPLTDLIAEALVNKGLREDQINELRRATQVGEVRLILLLDGYDELGPQFHFKNLYVSNTLEQYRKQESFQAANGSASLSWAGPKVIIATRTELLVRKVNYKEAFLPIEMAVEGKETKERALNFLVELRIAPFQKLDQYMNAKVAMDLRNAFQRQMGDLVPLSEEAAAKVREKVAQVWGLGANANQQPANNSTEDSMAGKELIVAACQAVTVIGGGAVGKERLDQLDELSGLARDHKDARMVPLCQMAAVFAMALADPPAELAKCIKGFCATQAKALGEDRALLFKDYKEAFDLIPELVELTTTPFTMEIVMEVLPQLQVMQSTETSIKQKLMLILDEFAMQLTWQQICQWRSKSDNCIGQRESPSGSELLILQKVQKALDGTAEERTKEEGLSALKELSSEVFKALKERRMHLNPKLVQLAQAQCGVHRQAGCTPGTGTGAEVESDPGTKIGMVDAVGKLLEMEKVICDDVVPHVLRDTLRRTKVRRSHMYAIFVGQYVERKAAGAGSEEHTAETVRRESLEYSQRLAVQMVCSSVSKVHTRIDSELFHQGSIWDPFLWGRGSKLLPTVQKVAPVQNNGAELSFIHKTVQEYLCAEALRGMLHKIFRDLAVDISELRQLQTQSRQNSAEKPAERHADPSPILDGGQEYPNKINVAEGEESDIAIGQRVAKSEWVQVKLWQEDVVRDFLVDMLIDDADFLEEMLICLEWAERCCQDQSSIKSTGDDIDALLRNMRSVLSGTLPKRNQGTLLHVVAAEGSYFAASKLLELKGTKSFEGLVGRRDDEERTPVFCAAHHGHLQVVAALRAAGADVKIRSKLQPRVQLIATVPYSLIPERLPSVDILDKGVEHNEELHVRAARHVVQFGQGNLITIGGRDDFVLEHGIVGAPAASPWRGRWRCEVEVNLDWNFFKGALPDEKQREMLAMGFCIGWSERDSTQMNWDHMTGRLQDALDPMIVDAVVDALLVDIAPKESSDLRAQGTMDQMDLQLWYQQLGFQLGMNEWSCGLRDTGEWHGSSGVAALPHDARSEPAAAAEAPLSLSCTIGMLIDCDARSVFVSRDGSAWVEHPMGEGMAGLHMFPAASWSGCHGTLAFNFGETPWKCFAAPPGGGVFRPIREVSSGNTPVMEAASEGHMDVCSLLLDRAATEDTGRRYRRTLLHWAAWWGDAKLAAQVLKVCPDPIACMRAIDGDGLNAVWHAADRGHAEVLRVLWRASPSVTGVLSADMTSKFAGADFNHVALEGRTPAHVAAEGGFTEALRVLKEAGADLSHADNDGKTPAHRAAAGGHAEALRELFLSTDCLRALDGQDRPPVWCTWCWALSMTQ